MKKFIVEFGLGTDFHGQDVTKAACKAAKDAISRSCLCGLEDYLQNGSTESDVVIEARIAVSRPEDVYCVRVAEVFPVGRVSVVPVAGGLTVDGLCIPAFGDADQSIEAAVAAVTVYINK